LTRLAKKLLWIVGVALVPILFLYAMVGFVCFDECESSPGATVALIGFAILCTILATSYKKVFPDNWPN
jgi:hypothetical protein